MSRRSRRPGRPTTCSVSSFGAFERIRVGRADETVSGTHNYVVRYTLANYVNGFEDHAEFYFNLVDPSNEDTYEQVSATRPRSRARRPGRLLLR